MNIFITGATGFAGRHVLSRIAYRQDKWLLLIRKKEDAGLFPHKNLSTIVGDLNELAKIQSAVRKFSPDVCIHLAWQGLPDYSEKISRLNLNQSIELFDFLMQETDCRKIISSGSCLEYGRLKGVCKESQEPLTNSFYAWAKQSLYRYTSLLCEANKRSLIWFRFFYVYGPGQRPKALIPTLVDSFRNHTVPVIKNPLNANDFVYIGDVAQAFHLAMRKNIPSGIYNLGSGKSARVIDVCKIAEKKVSGRSQLSDTIPPGNRDPQTVDFWADLSKIRRLLGWRPTTTLPEGVVKYIASLGQ